MTVRDSVIRRARAFVLCGVLGVMLWQAPFARASSDPAMVKALGPDLGVHDMGDRPFTDVAGTLFFWLDDDEHGAELWKSDGTEAGTVMVKDINPGAAGSHPDNL